MTTSVVQYPRSSSSMIIYCLLGELLLLPDEEGLDVVLVVILRVPGRECLVGHLSETRLQRPAVVFA